MKRIYQAFAVFRRRNWENIDDNLVHPCSIRCRIHPRKLVEIHQETTS